MQLEEQGVPTVAVHTQPFARLARSVARTNGMPTTRQAFVPQPIVGLAPAELRAYIEGEDPINLRPFVQEVIDGLTAPLTDEDLEGVTFERNTSRFLEPDTEENIRDRFEDSFWTDFLPITLPTEERVDAMLEGTSQPRDRIVGRLRPTAYREFWEFDVEKVAVNAVMAGAKPQYLPAILALAASGVTARSSSTTSFSALSVISGPYRDEIGMNSGIGAMGPYNHANATIGRAHQLLSINLQGGSVPGDTYMGTLGNPYNYSFCFAENEEESPWDPLHVQHGFDAEESAVSVFFGGRYSVSGYGPRDTWEEQMKRAFAGCEPQIPPVIVMDPIVARGFVDLGFDTKAELLERFSELAVLPARQYWDDQWVQTLTKPKAVAGVEPFATRLKAAPDELISIYTPDDLNVVVTGGGTQGAWRMVAGRRFPHGTVSIDDWR